MIFALIFALAAALGHAQVIARTVCGPGGPISQNTGISSGEQINAQTGTTYTYQNTDCGKLVTHSNGSAIAATLPQANSTTFRSGWFVDVQNLGAGTITITPTTSTIDGAATLTLLTKQGGRIVSNGSNYFTIKGGAGTTPSTGSVTSVDFTSNLGTVTGAPITTSGTIDLTGASSDIIALFSGCSGVQYLGADGSCHTAATGTVTSIATTSPIGGGTITTTGTITCTTCTTNASALTANLPVIGAGGQAAAVGTRSGNTTAFVTTTGTQTSGDCVSIDANGNHVADGAPCADGTVTSIATTSPITGGTITTTGTIACATCVTSAAALTSNQLVLGAGSQASQTLGSLGTTTTLLHGNAAGNPSFGNVVGGDFGSVTARSGLANATASSAAPTFSTTDDRLAYQVAEIPSQVFVTSNFTTSGVGTALEAITGLTWTMPASTALNIPFSCHLIYHQNVNTAAVAFGFQDATVAPTNLAASGVLYTSATVFAGANVVTSSTTTATAIVSGTPSAITTNWNAELYGYIEQPSNASSSVFTIRVSTATAARTVTVMRGSFCRIGI